MYQRNIVDILEDDQSDQVDFQLELASTISGAIRKADGGMLADNEIEHIKVEVHPAEGGTFFPYHASIEPDGSYSILGLPSGRSFNVSVQGNGTINYIPEWSIGAVSVPDPLELTGTIDITSPGSLINGVNFQLDSGATVQGKIYRGPELSSYNYKVVVSETTAEDACSMVSDSIFRKYTVDIQEDGSYTVTGLGPGTYYAKSYHYGDTDEWLTGINTDSSPDCQQAERLIVTNDNPTQVFDQRNFQVGTGGNISGTVFQTDGQTPADDIYHVRFQQSCTVAGDEPQTTVVSGQYTSPVLPVGDYSLALLNESGELIGWRTASGIPVADCADAVSVPVDEDQTIGINFILKNQVFIPPVYQAASIYGTVTDHNGQLAGVKMSLLFNNMSSNQSNIYSLSMQTESDGTYSFFIPPGSYLINIPSNWEDTPYAYQRKEVQVTEEEQSIQVDFQ
ncbi:MAG: carboxypeptidase regulatory-like domain-containing protein, partial [Candidatus Electrothrix sp. ATG1]|nr:carboxypeptidase regulatory-like domain-containing protein [Candidatus Electrothrix sp. ATG1]